MQRNWIGRSEGLEIEILKFIYPLKPLLISSKNIDFIEVYTTRPDTIYGASFV